MLRLLDAPAVRDWLLPRLYCESGLGVSLDRVREQVLRLAAERGGGSQQSA